MKARKYLIISFTFISVFLIFSNFTIHAEEIIETREVYEDGSMFIKLETPDGTITMKYFINSGYENDTEFYTSNGSSTPTSSEDDYFYGNIWMPDEFGGCLPQDVIYNGTNNKVYLYGGRRLVIIDGTTNTIINSLTVSDVVNITYGSNLYSLLPEKRLTYNSLNNKLYCATDAGELVIIDGETDEILTIYDDPDITNLAFTSVIYNEHINKLYWIINDMFTYRKIKIFDGESNQFIIENNWDIGIYDLAYNSSGDELFISTSYGVEVLNADDLSFISHYYMISKGAIIYNPNTDKVYIAQSENQSIAVMDGLTHLPISYIEISYEDPILLVCNQAENKIYCSARTDSDFGVCIIDGHTDEEIVDYPLDKAISLVYNPVDNYTACGGSDIIVAIDGYTDNILYSGTINGCRSHRLAYNESENTLISANLNEGTVITYDNCCNIQSFNQIGGSVNMGCYNDTNSKIYFFQYMADNEESFLSIINPETNEIEVMPIGYQIPSCDYNHLYNKIYIPERSDNIIYVIDGSSNQIANSIQASYIPGEIFACFNNKTYCSCYQFIDIINCETDQIITTLDTDCWIDSWTYNSTNNKVYAAQNSAQNPGQIYVIDGLNDIIINEIGSFDNSGHIISYNPINNKIYCVNMSSQTLDIINGETDQIICTLDIQNQISDMTFCDAVNKIYILRTSGITIIDGDQDIITNSLYIEGLTISKLIFNPINNRVYVHALFSNTLESRVYAIDCYTEEICSVIGLEQKVKPGILATLDACRSMIFNSANNQIVCANKGFSNVSVIQCYSEEKVLHPGWNWESFPRLMRVGNNPVDAVSVLENIDPFPTEIQFLGENGYLEYSLEYGWDFTGELYDIVSTSGYKLWTDNTVDSNLPTPGSRVAPDTPITLIASDYSYQLNWIGYWLPQTQMSDVAFGDEWNNIWSIKAEDYYYHDGSMEYKNGTSPTYPWGPIPMEYGKGYLVRVHNTITDFQWNNSGDNISVPEKLKSQSFTYTDKPDYEAINIVEIDEGIMEIGVFEDDICVGAAVVD